MTKKKTIMNRNNLLNIKDSQSIRDDQSLELKRRNIYFWLLNIKDTCNNISLTTFINRKTLITTFLNSSGMTNSMCEIRVCLFKIMSRSFRSIFSTLLILCYLLIPIFANIDPKAQWQEVQSSPQRGDQGVKKKGNWVVPQKPKN